MSVARRIAHGRILTSPEKYTNQSCYTTQHNLSFFPPKLNAKINRILFIQITMPNDFQTSDTVYLSYERPGGIRLKYPIESKRGWVTKHEIKYTQSLKNKIKKKKKKKWHRSSWERPIQSRNSVTWSISEVLRLTLSQGLRLLLEAFPRLQN